MWWLPRGSGWGGEWPGNALVCSLLQGTLPVEKQDRADHLALPAFGSLFCPLFSSCPRLCGCLWLYLSIADIWSADGSGTEGP